MLANMADSDGAPGDDESDDAQAESCMALNKQQLLGMWRVQKMEDIQDFELTREVPHSTCTVYCIC